MNLSEIADKSGLFIDGDWIEKKDQDETGEVRLIQLADIGSGKFLDKSNRHITDEKFVELHCTALKQGDILISRLGAPLCKACIFPFDGKYITAVDVAILRIGRDDINAKWLVYLFNSPWFKEQAKRYETGTTRKRISRKNLDKIDIAIPSLSEQERVISRIEEMFSELDAGVETLKKTKEQLAVYRQAVLKEAFSHIEKKVKLGNISESRLGKMLDKEKNMGTPRKYLRNVNVRWFNFDLSDLLEMKIEDNETDSYSLKKGDLVICEGGEPGRCAIWDKDESIFYQKALHRVRFLEEANPKFYMYYFWLIAKTGQLDSFFTGTGIKHLTGQSLKKVSVPDADISTQNTVVEKIESNFSVCNSIEKTIDDALQQSEALRQSILKEAFEGRL